MDRRSRTPSAPLPGFATPVGIAAAIAILLIAFGSFTAMSLPIITALIGLGAGLGVVGLASHVIDMANFASELALTIGLAVGVDYAMFIVTRFRENYRENGGDVEHAVQAALDSAGRRAGAHLRGGGDEEAAAGEDALLDVVQVPIAELQEPLPAGWGGRDGWGDDVRDEAGPGGVDRREL